jgi:hypothetical protein
MHIMIVEAQVTINGSRAAIWAAITNIENATAIISGIKNIEILEKPASGLVGLKWRETRMLFGKPASADKWITDAVENEFYQTKAEDGGFVFLTTKRISENSGGVTLTECHESKPQGIVAKFMSIPMRLFFKGVIKKALLQDLNDIKAAVEKG